MAVVDRLPSLKELENLREKARVRESLEASRQAKSSTFRGVSARTSGGYAGSINVRTRPPGIPQPSIGSVTPGAKAITSARNSLAQLPLKITPRGIGVVGLGILATELAIHNLKLAYRLYKLSQKEPHFTFAAPAESPSFTGGQGDGVLYRCSWILIRGDGLKYDFGYGTGNPNPGKLYGPIGVPKVFRLPNGEVAFDVPCKGIFEDGLTEKVQDARLRLMGSDFSTDWEVIAIVRDDGQPDVVENPPTNTTPSSTTNRKASLAPTTLPGRSLAPADNNVGWKKDLQALPGVAVQPSEQNKRKPIAIQIPPNTPIRFNFDPSTKIPPFTFQAETPATVRVAPAITNPATGKTETPLSVTAPSSAPINLYSPGSAPVTLNIPGQQPITINPDGSIKPSGLTPSLSQPRVFVPTPTQVPTPQLTPTTPETLQIPNLKDKDLQEIGLTLVGITALLKGIQPNVTPEALENAAAAGTCRTTQPGGCTSNAINNAVKKGNDDLANKLNNAANADQTLMLRVIDAKLGAQMPGGLSAGLGRMSKFLGIDRLFNVLNFLAILHNASMLSGSLKVTLLETLSSVGNATGLLQNSEGDSVDLNQVFNQGIESFVVSLIGAEAWASLKLTWRKYSPIYRAMNNGLSHIGNMVSSLGNGIEVIGERTGKIGNAIRAAGVVRDNAYNHMSERMNVHTNKFMTFQTTVGGVTEVLEAINEVAESTIEGQESYTEAVKATAEFKKLLNESDKNTLSADVENKAVKAEAEKIKENLVKDPTGEKDSGYFSFLTD